MKALVKVLKKKQEGLDVSGKYAGGITCVTRNAIE